MGMTEEQQVMLKHMKDRIKCGTTLGLVDCEILISWIEGMQQQNANWKQQCGRLMSLVGRIEKDVTQELLVYQLKRT